MTINQIKYFLVTAKYGNLSDAAKKLFITQPALGRQITALEEELNILVFSRTNKGVKLTPAGSVLYNKWLKIYEEYINSVNSAKSINFAISGQVKIGIINGLEVKGIIPELVKEFEEKYPNLKLILKRKSFKPLIEELHQGELDLTISFNFNFDNVPHLIRMNIMEYYPAFVIPINHRLANKEKLSFKDIVEEDIVIVNSDECKSGVDLIINQFRKYAGCYPKFLFTESMEDTILWVESGMKCAILNTNMILSNKTVKLYPIDCENENNYIQIAYSNKNTNFALDFVIKHFEGKCLDMPRRHG